MRRPLLSIGVPVCNGEKYLAGTLDLLLGQDFGDFELIISDNGSTDKTPSICRAYTQRDSRIRYYRSDSNQGATWNFRRVFSLAEGEYFKWATYDDECHPAMLRRCMEVMAQADDSVSLVYPRFEFIDESGSVIKPVFGRNWDRVATSAPTPHKRLGHVLMRLLHGTAIYGVIRSSFLRQARPFGSVAADWVKVSELAMLGKILEVPEVLFRYRMHPESSVNATATWKNLLAWHDPSWSGRNPLLPKACGFVLEYLKSIHHLPLSPLDKLRCYSVACATPPWRGFYLWSLHTSGPARIKLRQVTNWRWLAPGGGAA
jgi:glycosyltransferase involved in cell wall biosynthesis